MQQPAAVHGDRTLPRRPPVEVEPHQPGDVLGSPPPGDLGGGATLHRPPAVHHQQVVGQDHRLERVVRDEERRAAEAHQVLAQVGAHCLPGAGVERGQRLVSGGQRQGSPASALARATRCACPPDSAVGRRLARSATPSRSSHSAARRRASRLGDATSGAARRPRSPAPTGAGTGGSPGTPQAGAPVGDEWDAPPPGRSSTRPDSSTRLPQTAGVSPESHPQQRGLARAVRGPDSPSTSPGAASEFDVPAGKAPSVSGHDPCCQPVHRAAPPAEPAVAQQPPGR